ncbi:MAG: DNA polymerase III subunit gamma/tau [Bacteroidetes bacterium]|nr:DNA polymerase III subunit gamma/tau [Bacteroidota bacterium]
MEGYTVSARKYRPATFDTVVGQAHISNTLKNAIASNHLGHSFLFCGPRGVGKTTCARILAKTINCTNRTTDSEACGECHSCKTFATNQSLNVFELDAASNNSVDDIRRLVDQVRIPPQGGNFKTYIIDEVHMLSASAFNAFLKTLEEPPPYAIFILATTEKHKILPTIISRCQVFDFRRIMVSDIVVQLKKICKSEGVDAEDEALFLIGEKADGAMRDALSIFDRIVSFAGKTIKYQSVIENLSILDYDYYFKVVDKFKENDLSSVLLLFNEILEKGFDAHDFLNGLASHFRDLLVSKDDATLKLMDVTESTQTRYKQQALGTSTSFILSAMNIINQFDISYKASKNHRLHVELALIKLCHLNNAIQLVADPDALKKKAS